RRSFTHEYFEGGTKDTKVSDDLNCELRDLRVLRGKQNKLNATHAPDKSLNATILANAKGNRLARRSQSVFRRSAAGL
ncbi:MAG: hypothetical protein ACXWZE_20225, partial [Candidatus Binatia bacterium]